MKKYLFTIILILSCVLLFSSCKQGDTNLDNDKDQQSNVNDQDAENNICEHIFEEWITEKQPTCKEEGLLSRTCSKCSEKESTTIAKLNTHIEMIIPGINATCTQTGLTEGKSCSVCNETIVAQQEISMVAHTYENKNDDCCKICGHKRDINCDHRDVEVIKGKEATCTSVGLTDGSKCKKCGDIIVSQSVIPVKKHVEEINAAVKATCAAKGLTEGKHCSVCDVIIIAQQEIPMASHEYDNKYDENCNICGYKRDTECAHAESEVLKGRPATCTESGLSDGKKCKKCGEILVPQETIDKIAHVKTVDTAIASTCSSTGLTEGSHCSVCFKVIVAQQITPKIDHIESDWITDKAATVTESGVQHTECIMCKKRISEKTIPATGSVGLTYRVNSDKTTCTVTGIGTCTDKEIYIPEFIDGYTVTKIGKDSFKGNDLITAIHFPKTVIDIGQSAFYSCDGINDLVIPGNVENIGETAFGGCNNLGNVTIVEGVKQIGDYAFIGCKNLRVVKIPNSINSIGFAAFVDCFNIESITLPFVIEHLGQLFESSSYVYNDDRVPASLKTINVIGNKNIPHRAFYNCVSINNIIIGDEISSIGFDAFYGCEQLKSILIGNNVTKIGSNAFFNCDSLTSVIIPNSVKSIEEGVFISCGSLSSITIGNKMTNIGASAFSGCVSLSRINYEGTANQWDAISKGSRWDNDTGNYTIYCSDGSISK